MFLIYRILINLIILFSPLIVLVRIIKNKEDKFRFKEKFCFFSKKRGNGKLIWFHGSSVGEILSVIPLIEKLEKKKKIDKILVTSSTLSSSKVLSKFECVISLEDDICVSKHFLSYMNNALKIYKDEKKVWHINGFNYPIKFEGDFECFFMRSMQCWGWATWRDRWEIFTGDPLSCDPYYLIATFNKDLIKEFDLGVKRSVFWSQIVDNANGKLNNTWDIFWYSFIFLKKGLCLTPKVSMTRNIGHDGSGVHSIFDKDYLYSDLNEKKIKKFPRLIKENIYCVNKIRDYLNNKNRLLNRLLRKTLLIYKNLSKKI